MKTIYQAENIIDANLLKGLLEQEGLVAFINGHYLQGGIGELPASGLITVSVPDDTYEAAMRLVEAFEADLRKTNGSGETRWDPSDQLLDWER